MLAPMLGICLETGSLKQDRYTDWMEAIAASTVVGRWLHRLFFVPQTNPYPTHE